MSSATIPPAISISRRPAPTPNRRRRGRAGGARGLPRQEKDFHGALLPLPLPRRGGHRGQARRHPRLSLPLRPARPAGDDRRSGLGLREALGRGAPERGPRRRWSAWARSIRRRSTSRSAIRRRRGTASLGRPAPQILLLHANEVGAAQWDRLFTWLEGRGYRFAAAGEVLADAGVRRGPGYVGPSGFGLWDRLDRPAPRQRRPEPASRRCSRRSPTPGTAAISKPSPRSTPRTPPSSPPPASPRGGSRCWSATAAAIRTRRRWGR